MSQPLETFLAAYRAKTGAEPRGDHQKSARCPAHDDRSPSLAISEGEDGRVIVHCHAGCSLDAILSSLGLAERDLFPDSDPLPEIIVPALQVFPPVTGHSNKPITVTNTKPQIAETYDYTDEHGNELYQVVRLEPKGFRQRKRGPGGAWDWRIGDVRRVLYRLPQVLEAVKHGQMVWVVEGEKDVHTLEQREQVTATCNAGGAGAGKWLESYSQALAGANVTVVADDDEPGRAHAAEIAGSLRRHKCRVTVMVPAKGKDVTEHLDEGFELSELIEIDGGLKKDLTVDEFLQQEEPDHDWLIPELLERGERLIITGPEGGGKSTLLRQIALQVSYGMHPFALTPIEAKTVFLIDLENTTRHVRAKLRDMRSLLAPKELKARIRVHTQGLDLLSPIDQAWLEERIIANEPDLVCMGPLYKLAAGDPNEEQAARTVALFLDQLRVKHKFSLILEGHTPHAVAGGRRPFRPYGASLWMRWPEFGIHVAERGNVKHWRGPRDERDWPTKLDRGDVRNGQWPWMRGEEAKDATFAGMLQALSDAGEPLSNRRLAELLGCSPTTIGTAIRNNEAEWERAVRALGK